MGRKIKPVEGVVFTVPLAEGRAIGVLSRKRGAIGFGFFFTDNDGDPEVSLEGLRREAAAVVARFTLGALASGR